MNERIQQLADKVADMIPAGVYTIHYESGQSGVEFTEDALEKFAELIVQECVDIADEYDGVGSTIVSRIKKHFGVE